MEKPEKEEKEYCSGCGNLFDCKTLTNGFCEKCIEQSDSYDDEEEEWNI